MPSVPNRYVSIVQLQKDSDVAQARSLASRKATELGVGLTAVTKFVTAVSEIARNCIIHGGGGRMRLEKLREGSKAGILAIIEDNGPGIADIELAMTNGYTTKGGLGLGLGGSKRLAQRFLIESEVGKGTRVTLGAWK